MWNFNHRNLFPFWNCPIQKKLIDTQQTFVPVYMIFDFLPPLPTMPFQLLKVMAVFLDETIYLPIF